MQEKEKVELKPCPFCGSEAFLTGGFRGSLNIFYIVCGKCNAIGEKFGSKCEEGTREQAIKAWNKRWLPEDIYTIRIPKDIKEQLEEPMDD